MFKNFTLDSKNRAVSSAIKVIFKLKGLLSKRISDLFNKFSFLICQKKKKKKKMVERVKRVTFYICIHHFFSKFVRYLWNRFLMLGQATMVTIIMFITLFFKLGIKIKIKIDMLYDNNSSVICDGQYFITFETTHIPISFHYEVRFVHPKL